MPDTTSANTGADAIEFVQYHEPALTSGIYQITVTQSVRTADSSKIPGSSFSTARRFVVAGDRCAIKPEEFAAVFPPEGSLGDHSSVLPHVLLKRSTLPWERTADSGGARLPWLVLLLFEDGERLGGTIDKAAFVRGYGANGEAAWSHLLGAQVGWLRPIAGLPGQAAVVAAASRAGQLGADFAAAASGIEAILDRARAPRVLPLSALQAASTGGLIWPGLAPEPGQQLTDNVTVIDVEKQLLDKLMPTHADLEYLAHVRRAAGGATDELAGIVGSRLPKQGGISTVHLVSIERRYTASGFDSGGARDGDMIRLISLKSWSFACVARDQSFNGLLNGLNRTPGTLRLPVKKAEAAEKYLARGCVPLPHALRQGGRTVSWYHGPLVTGEHAGELPLPARAADELIRFDPAVGLLDVSYAAAWELGRLLTLQNKQVSASLYGWKRAYAQHLAQIEQRLLHSHLPVQGQTIDLADTPAEIAEWFVGLRRLEGVPFSYLVPDERMLPSESIRFVWMDHPWIDCLLDGAFSIGRATTADHQRDQALAGSLAPGASDAISGFLLRSQVVAGWPGIVVDAFDGAGAKLKPIRVDRLSSNVLLCLFAGAIDSAALSLKPETLHFGVDGPSGADRHFAKRLRDSQGRQPDNLVVDPIPLRRQPERVLDVAGLVAAMRAKLGLASFTSATFASQMVEGTPGVTFARG